MLPPIITSEQTRTTLAEGVLSGREEERQMVIDVLTQRADGLYAITITVPRRFYSYDYRFRLGWVFCQLDTLRRCFPIALRRILVTPWMKQMNARCSESRGRNKYMRFSCFSVSPSPFVLSMSKSSPRFLPSNLTPDRRIRNTARSGVLEIRSRLCYRPVLV